MITARSEKGQRIFEFLKKEMGLPDKVSRFSVSVGVDGYYKVEVEYYPADDECPPHEAAHMS